MALPRFYCPELLKHGDSATMPDHPAVMLPQAESIHARRVLRLGEGDTVALFDGCGTMAEGEIDRVADTVIVRVTNTEKFSRPTPSITIATAIPKGSRAEDMANQLSQLGVDELRPMICDRSEGQIRDNKLQRFERIAIESAKQCGRAWFMEIGKPSSIEEVLSEDADLRLMADVSASSSEHWRAAAANAGRIIVMIGPEGGWTKEERVMAGEVGAMVWRFSSHILRIETAAVAAAAILRGSL